MMNRLLRQWRLIALSLALLSGIAAASVYFYVRASAEMRAQLRDELRSVAAVAATNIDGDVVEHIRTLEDMKTPEFRALAEQLQEVRDSGTNIRFAYILRRTDNPDVLEFVADADALLTVEELDVNGNGVVDPDEEVAYTGEQYDIGHAEELRERAFAQPTAGDITVDQWGALISGFAPIYNGDGEVVATFAIDMQADDFLASSRRVFSPAALLLILLLGIIASVLVFVISEHRQITLLRNINLERSGLLRLTFHQLGEPLTIMKWSLESLREETSSPELKKLVEEHVICMDEGLGRLNSIIDTLQLAEKVDLDTLEYVPTQSSLRAFIDNAANEWEAFLRGHKRAVRVDMAKDVTLPLDKSLLTIALRQLLVNAIEYGNDGTDIHVRVRPGHREVTVEVRDEGCGIPKEEMEHLFQKYHRASNAHLKKPDGNGLGLYIARGIIEKAGGRIWVQSEPNKGTIVSFTLPFSQAA